jgi:hypothetical protein
MVQLGIRAISPCGVKICIGFVEMKQPKNRKALQVRNGKQKHFGDRNDILFQKCFYGAFLIELVNVLLWNY